MTVNPVSALTLAPTDRILDDPLVHDYIMATMAEAAEIGAHVGCPITQSGADRMAVTRQLGGFRTSMLQDLEAGRALELDALVSAVHEIGNRFGVKAPNIAALLGPDAADGARARPLSAGRRQPITPAIKSDARLSVARRR